MQLPILPPKVLAVLDALHLRVPLRTIVFGTIDFYHKLQIPFIRKTIKRLESQKAAEIRRTGRKIKVYFACIEKTQWGMQSIYDAMVDSDRFDPCVLVCEDWIRHGESDPKGDLARFFISKKMQVATSIDSNNLPDILFVPMFSWYKLGPEVDFRKLHRKMLIACVLYGWVTGKTDPFWYGNLEQVYLWRYYLFNNRELSACQKLSPIRGENAISIGFPRNDEFSSTNRMQAPWKTKNSKKIIWAPHWSILTHSRFGNFDRYAYKMLNWLEQNPDVEIILKPHPLLRARLTDGATIRQLKLGNPDFTDTTSFTTEQEYDSFMSKWANLPNGGVYDTGDYASLFASSDAMILDSISFMAEYMTFNKPMCFCTRSGLTPPQTLDWNELGMSLQRSMTLADSWPEIESFLKSVIEGNDLKRADRELTIKDFLSVNKGHVGVSIVENIASALN